MESGTAEIVQRRAPRFKSMDVRDARGVYRSYEELQYAIRAGTFDVRKTMYLDRNGTVYHLCFRDPDPQLTNKCHTTEIPTTREVACNNARFSCAECGYQTHTHAPHPAVIVKLRVQCSYRMTSRSCLICISDDFSKLSDMHITYIQAPQTSPKEPNVHSKVA